MTDLVPLVTATFAWTLLVIASALWPVKILPGVVAIGILVPVDLGTKIGNLPRLGPSRLVAGAFVLGWAIRTLVESLHRRWRTPLRQPFPPRGVIVAYLGVLGVSAALSIDLRASLYTIADAVVVQVILAGALWHALGYAAFWPRLRRVLYAVTLLLCMYAFYEFATQSNPLLALYPEEELIVRSGVMRVRSVFFHPIAFGSYLSLVAPLTLADALSTNGTARRVLLFGLVAVMAVCAVLTVSRVPIAGMVGAFGVVFWQHTVRRPRTRYGPLPGLVGLATVGALAVCLLPGEWASSLRPSQVAAAVTDESSSEYYRVALLKAVVARLEGDRWIYGFGPGTFRQARVESRYAGANHILTAADSHYAKLLLEDGVLGLTAFTALLMIVFRMGVRAVRRARQRDRLLAVACLASLTFFALENVSASMFDLGSLAIPFWLIVGCLLWVGRMGVREKAAPMAGVLYARDARALNGQRPVHVPG